MKSTVFEVIEIGEHYGLDYTISLGLFNHLHDARVYFENRVEREPHGNFKLRVRTIH